MDDKLDKLAKASPLSLSPLQIPSPLQPGDLVRGIAPSGAVKEWEALERGLEIWRCRGYRVELGKHWNARYGYLGGRDSQRRQDLWEAWNDPNCRAILCARGGYGSARLLEDWSWGEGDTQEHPNTTRLRQFIGLDSQEKQGSRGKENIAHLSSITFRPKWLIGFSDVTGLLWSLARAGIAGVHGPVLTTLASEPEWSRQRLFDWVEGRPLDILRGQGWGGGEGRGRLLPANLTVATHLLGTPIQPSFEDTILALEDVTEAPYRIDRLLTQWRMVGALARVKGIALGRFSRCDPPPGSSSWTVEEVLRDRLSDLGIPIVSHLPFGHDGVNAALPVGTIVKLDGGRGILSFESR